MTANARPDPREQLRQQLAPLQARWKALAERERLMLVVMAAVLLLGALWAWAVAPAWRTLQQAPVELESLELQLQQMQRLAAETRELRALPPVPAGAGAQALRSATDRLGNKARLSLQGDRAVLTLQGGIQGDALRGWLTEARSVARARVVEAQLTRGADGFAGTVIVSLGSGA